MLFGHGCLSGCLPSILSINTALTNWRARIRSPPHEDPVIDRFAEVPCLDPLAAVKIGDGAGDGQNPIAGIGIQGIFGHRRPKQVAAVVAQFQGLMAGLGLDLVPHLGQRGARRVDRISRSGGQTISMLMSATGNFRRCRSIWLLAALAGPARIVPVAARARPNLEGRAEAEFQGDGPEHGLAAIRRADEENRVVSGSGDHQGPLCHFVAANDAGGVMAVGGGLGIAGRFR